jgi:hypothetical protein
MFIAWVVPGRKDDLGGLFRIQVSPQGFSSLLIGVGRLLRQRVNTPMNIGVVPAVVIYNGVYDLNGRLRSGGIIEINQGFPFTVRFSIGKSLRMASTSNVCVFID